MSLLSRLFLLVAVAILPAVLIQGYHTYTTRLELTRAVHEEALRHAAMMAAELETTIEGVRQFTTALAQLKSVREGRVEACHDVFARMLDEFPQYYAIDAARFGEEETLCGSAAGGFKNLAEQSWFIEAVATGKLAIGRHWSGPDVPEPLLHFAYPFRTPEGAAEGAVVAALNLSALEQRLARKPLPAYAALSIADRNGTILARVPEGAGWIGKQLPLDQLYLLDLSEPLTVEATALDGVRKIIGVIPPAATPSRSFIIRLGLDSQAVFAEIDARTRNGLWLLAFGLAAALASAAIVARSFIRRPVERVLSAVARWRAGDFTARTGLAPGRSELARLGAAFDEMADQLAVRDQQLFAAKEHAESANRTKSAFLANMSHELRTPLNAILGFSEIIRDGFFGLHQRYQEYAGDIHRSGTHLLTIVNDILDLSKIDAGRLTLHDEKVELRAIIVACRALVAGKALENDVRLAVATPADLPALYADELRLKQILLNLMSNAVKYTPAGGTVTVSASLGEGGDMVVTIADSGIGMTAEEIALALQAFGRADGALARKIEGTGLGLPLAKQLTELHGGTLTLDSEPGRGTIATVRLPAARVLHFAEFVSA